MNNKRGMGNCNFEYFFEIATFQRCDNGQTKVYIYIYIATSFSVSSTPFPHFVFIVLACQDHKKEKYTLV